MWFGQVDIKDYESTKIMLHFSHFKILDDSRVTCFRDPPHQCPEYATKANATVRGGDGEEDEGGRPDGSANIVDSTGVKSEL